MASASPWKRWKVVWDGHVLPPSLVKGRLCPIIPAPRRLASLRGAQTHEQELFGQLLRELCDGVPQPPQKMGRPRLPLSDMIFSVGTKIYSTMSGRRAMTDVRNAQANGQLDKTPSFTSVFRYLETPELTPLLKSLIEQSALPLKGVETDFAADSSGFSTSVYDRWFDHKWGKEKEGSPLDQGSYNDRREDQYRDSG